MPTARLSLRSNFAWTFAGNVANGASQWAILSLIAKLGGAHMLGEYALAMAVAFPASMLAHLNLRAVLATDVEEQHPFADYFFVRLLASSLGLAASAVLAMASPRPMLLLLIALSLALEAVSELYYAVMQRRERLDVMGRSLMLRSALTIALTAGALWLTRNVLAAGAALVMSRLLILVTHDVPLSRVEHGRLVAPRKLLWATAPLGLVLLLVSLTTNLPRYAIEQHRGTAELGVFAAVASFITVGSTLTMALGQSAITPIARAFSSGDRPRFRLLSMRLVLFAAALGAAGIISALVAGRLVLAVFYRPEFAEHQPLLVAVLAAGTLSYVAVALGYVLSGTRQFTVQLPLLAVVAASSAAASWLLVPSWGLTGGAAAIAIAGAVQITGQLWLLRQSL